MKFLLLALTFLSVGWASGADLPKFPEGKRYAWVSWGDIMWLYGPGTDPAMDTPEALTNTIHYWKKRGFAGVQIRTDLQQIEPFIQQHPKKTLRPAAAIIGKAVDDVMHSYDIFSTGQKVSEAAGMEFWAWHPHLYSDGAPPDAGAPGHGRNWPWTYQATFLQEHPEALTVDRKGNKYWMVREYAYPGARSSKVEEFVYMAKTYGVRRFVADMRSEANQMQDAADKADRFGFNEPVVQEMKRLYNVDILTDPRFDVDSPQFDLHDPMVENWRTLRGTYVTQFFRELRQGLAAVDPAIQIAVTLSGDYVGPPLGNWKLDWRTWVDEGLVDQIIVPTSFEATHDLGVNARGYLTNINAGIGQIPIETLREHIRQSRHPEIKLIATGAPSYFYPPPPAGTDGWRCNMFYDAYHLAWSQRWEQWKRDLDEFGHIKFIEQNFDEFPTENNGIGGGWGDGRYFPSLRASPGFWETLGDGKDEKPIAQETVRHGKSGRAMRLVASDPSSSNLVGKHYSAPDRSTHTACLDTAITNGKCEFEFWLHRANEKSAVIAYLQGDRSETDVSVKIIPDTGRLWYSNQGEWVESSHSLPVGEWQKVVLKVDLDRRNYQVFAGADGLTKVSPEIPCVMPAKRIIEESGAHLPIEVPAWKYFNTVLFIPQGPPGSVTYLDDVAVNWTPTTYSTKPGNKILFSENFESSSPGDLPAGKLSSGQPEKWLIENHTSFGEGAHCLRSKGGAEITADLDQIPAGLVTIDLDIFIRSDRDFAHIISNPLTKSPHRTTIGLRTKTNPAKPVASVLAVDGKWQYWDGAQYVASQTSVAYDVWNHLQLALDPAAGTYQIVVQPVGEMSSKIGQGTLGERIPAKAAMVFSLAPSKSAGHISCYDNIVITGADVK